MSHAKALAVLVANPTLLLATCNTVEQIYLVKGRCRFVELCTTPTAPATPTASTEPEPAMMGGQRDSMETR